MLGLALASLAIAAVAGASPTDPYAGSGFYAPYDGTDQLGYADGEVGGEFHYQPYDSEPPATETTSTSAAVPDGGYIDRIDLTVSLENPSSVPAGCPADVGTDTFSFRPDEAPSPGTAQVASFVMIATFQCNGRYTATATAHVEQPGDNPPVKQLTSTFTVAVAPPPVTGLTATPGASRRVNLAWDAAIAPAPDFIGYSVWRRVGAGSYVRVGSVRAGSGTTFTDERVPVQGGELTYRVLGVRTGGASGFVQSEDATATLTVAGLPAAPAGGARPRVGRGGLSLAPPTTADTGFSEELPYGEVDANAQDAQSPDDLASVLYEGDSQPKGMLVPAAVALVMLGWAMHFRYLARRASQPI